MKSDYEPEDMNLDSDTESTVGGITFYQDTALIERRICRKRARQKAKNQRRKASKKRAKQVCIYLWRSLISE